MNDKSSFGSLGVLTGVLLTVFVATFVPAHAQCRPGLHAGIRAQIVPLKGGYTEPAHVQLSFLLLNDSESLVDVVASSWKIVVDGVELPDSGFIFGNGIAPGGGWKTLRPGEHYSLGRSLPLDKYFTHRGEHRVSWRGEGFQSPTITVQITADPVAENFANGAHRREPASVV